METLASGKAANHLYYFQDVFGLYNVPLRLSYKPDQTAVVENVNFLAGNTVYAFRAAGSCASSTPPTNNAAGRTDFNCPFVNIQQKGGNVTSLLLENPVGHPLDDLSAGLRALKITRLFRDEGRASAVPLGDLRRLAGQTLFA